MRRRELLRSAALMLTVSACAPLRLAPPTATPAATTPSALELPTYIPFHGPKPDIEGNANGLPPAYKTFPQERATTVNAPTGKGGDVSILTFTNAPAPPAI